MPSERFGVVVKYVSISIEAGALTKRCDDVKIGRVCDLRIQLLRLRLRVRVSATFEQTESGLVNLRVINQNQGKWSGARSIALDYEYSRQYQIWPSNTIGTELLTFDGVSRHQ